MSIVTCAACDGSVDSDLDTECFAPDGSGKVLCKACRESPEMTGALDCETDDDMALDVCEHMVGFDEDCELCDEGACAPPKAPEDQFPVGASVKDNTGCDV